MQSRRRNAPGERPFAHPPHVARQPAAAHAPRAARQVQSSATLHPRGAVYCPICEELAVLPGVKSQFDHGRRATSLRHMFVIMASVSWGRQQCHDHDATVRAHPYRYRSGWWGSGLSAPGNLWQPGGTISRSSPYGHTTSHQSMAPQWDRGHGNAIGEWHFGLPDTGIVQFALPVANAKLFLSSRAQFF